MLLLAIAIATVMAARAWLRAHPEDNPWAPLDLRDPPGWATAIKLRALRNDAPSCRAVLERSAVAFATKGPTGDGACARPDRTILTDTVLRPREPATTCPVAVGFTLWERDSLVPAAHEILAARIVSIDHLGTYSCRRMYGSSEGPWSEHATGNAIDIAGFRLDDGTTISVLKDWHGTGAKSRFLHRVRDEACRSFSTVLSPDYNAAHRDHLHLDMAHRWGVGAACR